MLPFGDACVDVSARAIRRPYQHANYNARANRRRLPTMRGAGWGRGMTKKYIDLRQVVAAFRVAAYGVEESAVEGLTLSQIYNRLDDALRVVVGQKTFNALNIDLLAGDDEADKDEDDEDGWAETDKNGRVVDESETPKF